MNPVMKALARLFAHKLLWLKETLVLLLAAAHVPLWLWLPVSGYGWLALHAVLPVTMGLLVWLALRLVQAEMCWAGRFPWLGVAVGAVAGWLMVWGLLSFVPVFGSVAMQTASFVARALAGALLAAGALLFPFAIEREGGQ